MKKNLLIFILGGWHCLNAQYGMVRGTAWEGSEQASFAACVQLIPSDPNERILGTTTDAAGYFGFIRIPIGHYNLKIHQLGFEDYEEVVEVVENTKANVKAMLKTDSSIEQVCGIGSCDRISGCSHHVTVVTWSPEDIIKVPVSMDDCELLNLYRMIICGSKSNLHFCDEINSSVNNESLAINDEYLFPVDLRIYPNPVAEEGVVQVTLPEQTSSTLDIIDLFGKQLLLLHNGKLNAGDNYFPLQKTDFQASGAYIVRLQANGITLVKKVLVN